MKLAEYKHPEQLPKLGATDSFSFAIEINGGDSG
jgi:hypothetical protein